MDQAETEKGMAEEIWKQEIQSKYTTTWTSPDGKSRRQIDYVMINAKYKKTAGGLAQSNI